MKIWNNPKAVKQVPLITMFLFDGGAIGQIIRMWTVRSALGQSLISWIGVSFGLFLWVNYYRIMTPELKLPRYSALFSACINSCVWLTIIYFRYIR